MEKLEKLFTQKIKLQKEKHDKENNRQDNNWYDNINSHQKKIDEYKHLINQRESEINNLQTRIKEIEEQIKTMTSKKLRTRDELQEIHRQKLGEWIDEDELLRDHYVDFSGDNCQGECEGWNPNHARCQCGNRRVMWSYHSDSESSDIEPFAVAY